MSAEEVLAAFRRSAPNLFLGAAFAAVGTVSLPLSCCERKALLVGRDVSDTRTRIDSRTNIGAGV